MIDAVIQRIKDRVADLGDRVEGAAAFTAIVDANAWPSRTPAAFVLPTALRGGPAQASTGAFIQDTSETFGVVLILRPIDRLAARGIEPVEALREEIIAAIAGWAPGDQTGVFSVGQARMLNVRAGALAYQIDFTITDQLRIFS